MAQDPGTHRLPDTIRPLGYDLRLDIDPDADGFTGSVAIDVHLDRPTAVLVVHSVDLEWSAVRLEPSGSTEPLVPRLAPDSKREWMELHFDSELPAGDAILFVEYSGQYCENLVGLYVSEMNSDGEPRRLAVTQCESTHARRILPCFDEPAFKATFSVTLVVPDGLTAISNGAEVTRTNSDGDTRTEVRFAPTMVMSSYLLALVVGPLEITEGSPVEGREGDIALRVVHPPGKSSLCAFALEVATQALSFFEDYYDLAYPGDKVDLVAIPDFAFGAMENMGCITFREVLLLVDPDEATPTELQRVADVINHELAHMWFGNLVTMRWWNGIWLNEAFATFMEVSASDSFRPEWDVWTTFGLARAAAFETDALWSTRPIEFEVVTAADSEAMFDILTYEKGCSVLRMFEQYLGADRFRDGIRRYLRIHAYSNTETTDLWDALEKATGEPVRRIAEAWIFSGGHPLVDVSIGDSVEFDQRRALYRPEPPGNTGASPSSVSTTSGDDTIWPVPMTMAFGSSRDGSGVHRLLLEESAALPDDADGRLLRPNVGGSGFYRTLLPLEQRRRLVTETDSALERFVVLDDTWFAVMAGHLESSEATATVADAVAAGESDPSVWRRIGSIISELIRLSSPEQLPERRDWIRATLGPTRADFPTSSRGRPAEVAATIMSVLARLGEEEAAVLEASEIFASGSPESDPRAGQDPAVCAGALEVVAHSPTDHEYEQILRRWRGATTPQDEQRHMGAIVSTVKRAQFESSLDLCLDEIRTQDAPYVLRRALANRELGPLAWEFVSANFQQIRSRYPSGALPRLFDGIRGFTNPALAAEVQKFLVDNPLPTGSQQIAQHIERMWASVEAAGRIAAEGS